MIKDNEYLHDELIFTLIHQQKVNSIKDLKLYCKEQNIPVKERWAFYIAGKYKLNPLKIFPIRKKNILSRYIKENDARVFECINKQNFIDIPTLFEDFCIENNLPLAERWGYYLLGKFDQVDEKGKYYYGIVNPITISKSYLENFDDEMFNYLFAGPIWEKLASNDPFLLDFFNKQKELSTLNYNLKKVLYISKNWNKSEHKNFEDKIKKIKLNQTRYKTLKYWIKLIALCIKDIDNDRQLWRNGPIILENGMARFYPRQRREYKSFLLKVLGEIPDIIEKRTILKIELKDKIKKVKELHNQVHKNVEVPEKTVVELLINKIIDYYQSSQSSHSYREDYFIESNSYDDIPDEYCESCMESPCMCSDREKTSSRYDY